MLGCAAKEGRIKTAVAILGLALAGCASLSDEPLLASSAVVAELARETGERVAVARFSQRRAGEALPAHWTPYLILPSKPRTDYRLVETAAGIALEASADRSASGIYRRIRIDPRAHPVLEWRWRVENLIPGADTRFAASEDSPARLMVSFHGNAERLAFGVRSQLRLARALSGQALPYATLMYVWSNSLPVGTVVENPHLERIRMIVVASGADGVGEWRSYRRNVFEDYRRAFGEEPWDIVAVGVMTDADNTRQQARCQYGDITFLRAP